MGVILPKPILSKVVDRIGNSEVVGGCCCINGFRNTMEDAHCMEIGEDRMLFGVFDGHSNDKCSQYVAEHLPRKIKMQTLPLADTTIEKLCVELDEQFLEDVGDGGTTGTFCIVERGESKDTFNITVANVGDSRILIVRDSKIIFQTIDHKPLNPEERQRIERCGGTVRMNRVDGDLAVSRAFGDGMFKKFQGGTDLRNQKVIAVPDISRVVCQKGDVIILACDGVFEGSFPNEEVARFVSSQLPPPGGDYGVVAGRTCDAAVKNGSKDNISCMIIHFTDGTAHVPAHGQTSFMPGPVPTKTHEASRTAYARMASIAGVAVADAYRMRWELLQAYLTNQLTAMPPLMQIAFEMSDEIEIQTEKSFFGNGPSQGSEKEYFQALADGGR